ncbi:tail length tape measure protein [Dinoroseobacter phage vB_DshS-R5C]|uniref:Tail tape measure protein n=1 Tax=Dinoroseobacter phage vB_DshS-R5C TaxID=1965368 RepID=A0A1V0DYA9_9CAUD|nr:tail length tape measure protein [Dinoroseobacter phage vB_DshS-R5C]ARB06117.1 tail tape measure protein [Dinoroseobacter phage vB_DshS-R5C]
MVEGARKGERALDGLGRKAGVLGETFDRLNTRTNLLARAFEALVAVGIATFFTQAVTAAGSFETAMAEVSTLVDETVFNLGRLEDAILAQSRAFGAAPVQQAAAAYQIISAGASTATEAIDLLDASNRLAIGGVTDVATAADGLTSVLNAYGMAASEVSDVSDVLFVGMRAGKTTIGELASSLGNVAPLAAQAGVGFDELVASIAALTKGGISTQQAVTGVRAILAAVTNPTVEAADMAERLGLNFNAAALESRGFAGFMEDVVTATGGSSDAMAQLFGGVEALVPALALAGQAGVDMTAILEDMEERGGATQEAFERMTNTFEFQSARLRQSLMTALIELGSIITSALTPAIKFLADNFDALSRFVMVAAAGFTALMIPAVIAMIPAIASATAGLVAMAAAWLLTPFGAIQALIIGAAAALAYFGDTNVEVAGRVATVWQVLKAVLMTVGQYFGRIYDIAVTAFQGIVDGLADFGESAYNIFLQVWNWATSAWDGAKASAGNFFSNVAERLDEFLGNWGLSLDTIADWIKGAVNFWIGLHVGLIAAIRPTITEGIPALFELAMAKAKNMAIQGLQNIINVFVRGLGGLGDALDLIPGFEGIGDAIRESLTVDFSDLQTDTAALEANLASAGANIGSAFGEALNVDYVGNFGTAVREGAETVRTAFDENILGPFNDALTRTGQTLANDFGANLDTVIEQQETSSEIQEQLNTVIEDGTPVITDFGDAAGGAAGQLRELNAAQQEYIDGLTDEYEQIVQNNGGARDAVRAWYQEQLMILEDLGLKYEDYATMIETIFEERMKEAREQDLENATDWASGISRALDSIEADIGTAADRAESMFKSAFDKSADALADFVMTGKLDFGELARSIIADIIKMQTRMLLFNAIKMAFPGFADGGMVPVFADGGRISGPGTGRSDSILARVSNGEYIVNAKATREFLPMLNQINSGQMPTFADGGLAMGSIAAPRRMASGDEQTNRGDNPTMIFNITTPDAQSFKQSEGQIANRMRRMAQRGVRGA